MRGIEEIVRANKEAAAREEHRFDKLCSKIEELQRLVAELSARVAVLTDRGERQEDKLSKIEAEFIASARRSM